MSSVITKTLADGILCADCGGFIDDFNPGHPRWCDECQSTITSVTPAHIQNCWFITYRQHGQPMEAWVYGTRDEAIRSVLWRMKDEKPI